jgi:hypothetical protein
VQPAMAAATRQSRRWQPPIQPRRAARAAPLRAVVVGSAARKWADTHRRPVRRAASTSYSPKTGRAHPCCARWIYLRSGMPGLAIYCPSSSSHRSEYTATAGGPLQGSPAAHVDDAVQTVQQPGR